MSKPDFRAEVVSVKDIEYFKCYHNPKSDQAQIMTITPDKAQVMIDALSEYLKQQ